MLQVTHLIMMEFNHSCGFQWVVQQPDLALEYMFAWTTTTFSYDFELMGWLVVGWL